MSGSPSKQTNLASGQRGDGACLRWWVRPLPMIDVLKVYYSWNRGNIHRSYALGHHPHDVLILKYQGNFSPRWPSMHHRLEIGTSVPRERPRSQNNFKLDIKAKTKKKENTLHETPPHSNSG